MSDQQLTPEECAEIERIAHAQPPRGGNLEEAIYLAGRAAGERERERLREALSEIMQLITDGKLVRDTSRDAEQGWAMQMIPFMRTLSKANALLARQPDAEKSR